MSKDRKQFIVILIITGTLFLVSVIMLIISIYNKHKLEDKFESYQGQDIELSPTTYACIRNNEYTYINYDLYDGYEIPKVVYVLADDIRSNNNYVGNYDVSVRSATDTEITYLIEYEDDALWFVYEDKPTGVTYALQYFGQLD